jgi:hypothetical protein
VGRLVAERFELAISMESDWFWATIVSGKVLPWLPEASAQNETVLRACATAAGQLASGGYTVVMNGIFGPWYLDLVVDEIGRTGVELHYVVLRPDVDVALRRATTRAPLDPETAPLTDEGPVRHMWEQFRDLGPLEHHVVDNGAQEPEETANVVWTRFVNGTDRL